MTTCCSRSCPTPLSSSRADGSTRLGPPTDMVKRFWEDITLPSFEMMAAEIKPGNPVSKIHEAGKFFRQKGVQSRPIHAHGIDLITDGPHVFTDGVHGEKFEQVFRP